MISLHGYTTLEYKFPRPASVTSARYSQILALPRNHQPNLHCHRHRTRYLYNGLELEVHLDHWNAHQGDCRLLPSPGE